MAASNAAHRRNHVYVRRVWAEVIHVHVRRVRVEVIARMSRPR